MLTLRKTDMPNSPVKYLNEKCSVRVGARLSLHHFEQAMAEDAGKYAKVMLAEQLGHSLLERMPVATRDDSRSHERVYTAEAYVLTPAQAQVLWGLMRDEAIEQRRERIRELERQLEEAKEAAAGADKTAEGRYRACQALELVVGQKRKKIHKLEMKVRSLESSLADKNLMVERMGRELRGEDDESV